MQISLETIQEQQILTVVPQKDLVLLASNCGSRETKEFILFKWKEVN
ncbi:MAG: hypothetical protein AB1299_07590 [Thermoproteota archaeon]